jgi:LemA protein
MKKLLIVVGVLVLLGVVAASMYVGARNEIVRKNEAVNSAWSQVDVVLQRRADLIPNLVETVKGYAAHERGVFDEVTQARAGAIAAGAQGPQQRAAAEDMLTGALRSLFAVAEAYPQLQAVQEFKDLSENLRDTEDKIQFARRFYNSQVRDYNTALQTFPTMLLASSFGFTASEYFEVEAPTDREVPKVSFTPST